MTPAPPVSPAPAAVNVQGNVAGAVVNGNYNLVVNTNNGTIVYQAPKPPVTRRKVVPRAPNQPLLFLDRVDEAAQVSAALTGPGPNAAALYGRDGVGKSTLLRQVANHLPRQYADGILLINGSRETGVPQSVDDLAQDIFDTLYDSDPHLKVNQNTVRPHLEALDILVVLDRVTLPPDQLDQLPDLCRSVVWSATQPPRGQVAHLLAVPGLPRAEAVALFVRTAQLAPAAADQASLNQVCELLEDLPLAIVTLARWAQARRASPAQALELLKQPAASAETRGVRRALMAVVSSLTEPARALLGLAGTAHGATVGRAELIEASGIEAEEAGRVLDELQALGLLHAHSPEFSLHPAHRDIVRQRLPVTGELDRRLAGIFLREALAHAGDLAYLRAQLGNLLGALDRSEVDNDARETKQLAQLLVPLLVLDGRWDVWQQVFNRVSEVAGRTGDSGLQAWALHELGTRALALGDKPTATRLLTEALNLRKTIGDTIGAAYTQHNLDALLLGPPPQNRPGPPKPPPPNPVVAVVAGLVGLGGLGLVAAVLSVALCARAGCFSNSAAASATTRPAVTQVTQQTPTPFPVETAATTPAPVAATTQPAVPTTQAVTTAAPTTPPVVTTVAVPTTAVPTTPPAPTPIPRNQTVILGWSILSPVGVTNPWAVPGYTHQEGNNFMWEPLAYFGIFSNQEIPWLADSMTYNSDFTQLTIKLNPLAAWSDGQPVTSDDVGFTFDGQMNNARLPEHADFQQFVQGWQAPDAQTVILDFKVPAPRFKYEVLTFKFDTGIPIVPKHVLGDSALVPDVNAYAGGLDMPHSGPYNLVSWDAGQKVYVLNENWWAIKAGRSADPAVKQIIVVNISSDSLETLSALMADNKFDAIRDVPQNVITSILKANSSVTSWTGQAPPYGNLDWWPNSLWMNDQLYPYSNPNVRRAISLVIDRDRIDKDIYGGAPISTIYPFPLFPNLQKFADSALVKEYAAKYTPRLYDPTTSAGLMTAAGFTKNDGGLWADANGNTVNATIDGFASFDSELAPLLVEMLKAGGFDASVNFGNDAYSNMMTGKPGLYLFGHGASTFDPYATLDLFHSRHSAETGTPILDNAFSRYRDPKYDQLINEMAVMSPDDPHFTTLAAAAMGFYWRDTIDIPIVQWLQRIPDNQTYWTNWPLANNLAGGENGAFWSETGMLVITQLKPVTPS